MRQEAARVEAEGRQRAGELNDQVQKLAMAKAEAEAEFQSNLEAKALKEAALKRRIQTINELQEKALGVESKPHTTGTPRSLNKNAARAGLLCTRCHWRGMASAARCSVSSIKRTPYNSTSIDVDRNSMCIEYLTRSCM